MDLEIAAVRQQIAALKAEMVPPHLPASSSSSSSSSSPPARHMWNVRCTAWCQTYD
jgi:hypothetical protein